MAVNLVQERRWICLSTRQSCFPPSAATIPDARVECPPHGVSPDLWTREEVRSWLENCVSEYGLNLDLPDRFPMNGKGLCMLRKEDFRQRAPDAGDVLYNSFHSFYGSPSTPPYGRSSPPDALTLKRNTMDLEREGHWFDSSLHRSDCDSPAEVDYRHMTDSSEPLNLKVTRSAMPSPPVSSPQPSSVSRASAFDLSATQPFHLFMSPTNETAIYQLRPLQESTTFDSTLNRPLLLPGSSTFDPDPIRPRDWVGDLSCSGSVLQSHLRLHTPSLQPSYLPLPLRPRPYVDLRRNIPSPASSPPSSLLSSSSLSPPPPSPHPSVASSFSHFLSTYPRPTIELPELPSYHSSLSSTSSYLLSSSTSSTPLSTAPSSKHGYCTTSSNHLPASGVQAFASNGSFGASPISGATIGTEESGMEQRQTPNSPSTTSEVTPNWSQLMQVSTTSQTPEATSKIHLNLSTSDRLLWKFLAELLNCQTAKCVSWEDRQRLTFQIVDPDELAELWGVEKCKPGMTYEKLSRALRYYYKMNIIAKVPGKRLTYRFITSPQFIKKGKRGAKPGVPHKRRTGVPLSSKTVANQNQTKAHLQQQQHQQQPRQQLQD